MSTNSLTDAELRELTGGDRAAVKLLRRALGLIEIFATLSRRRAMIVCGIAFRRATAVDKHGIAERDHDILTARLAIGELANRGDAAALRALEMDISDRAVPMAKAVAEPADAAPTRVN